MKRIGQFVCMADSKIYKILNLNNGVLIPLFPFDREINNPLIIPLKEEFLLTCDGENKVLGIFITKVGDPTKGTLEWPFKVTSGVFSYPWIISTLENSQIYVHNVFNQELVQIVDLPYNSKELRLYKADFGIELDNSILNVFCTGSSCFGIVIKDLQTLLSELIESKQVSRAIFLAETLDQLWDQSTYLKKLKQLYTKGAETLLYETFFQEAFELYLKAKVDPKIIISFFPDWNTDENLLISKIGNF